jgi:hypothetical protein
MNIKIILLLLGLALFSAGAYAKPEIRLLVTLNEKLFRRQYPNDIAEIERLLSVKMAEHLNAQIPLFAFTTAGKADDTLHVSFLASSASIMWDESFLLRLSGDNVVEKSDEFTVLLAKHIQYSGILNGTYKDFVNRVANEFMRGLKIKDLISHQLQHVLIPKLVTAAPDFNRKCWEFAYTHRQMAIFSPSRFRVRHEYETAGIQFFMANLVSSGPNSRITIRAQDLQNDPVFQGWSAFKSAGLICVKGVHVIEIDPGNVRSLAPAASLQN